MRTLHADALAALDSGRFGVRCLLKAELASGLLCLWDDVGNVVYDGDTYYGAPGRFTVSGVSQELGVTVPKMDVVLSGLDNTIVGMIDGEQWHERSITVFRAIVTDGMAIHVMPEFAGFMDQLNWSEGAGGTSTITVSCESASREISRTFARTRSDVDQRTRDSDDAFLEFAHASVSQTINWGGYAQKVRPTGIAKVFDKWF